MPFVIPRISVPADYNTTNATRQSEYDPAPTLAELQKYEEWLCDEIVLVREAIAVAGIGGERVQVTPTGTQEKQ